MLDAIVESAARICGIDDLVLHLSEGDVWSRSPILVLLHIGSGPKSVLISSISLDSRARHAPHPRRPAQNDFPSINTDRLSQLLGRSSASARRIHWSMGARRIEVRPFTPVQIKLLETFADQAVIAMENVRLFERTQGGTGTADRNEQNPRRDCQFTDRLSAGAGWRSSKRGARLCEADRRCD